MQFNTEPPSARLYAAFDAASGEVIASLQACLWLREAPRTLSWPTPGPGAEHRGGHASGRPPAEGLID